MYSQEKSFSSTCVATAWKVDITSCVTDKGTKIPVGQTLTEGTTQYTCEKQGQTVHLKSSSTGAQQTVPTTRASTARTTVRTQAPARTTAVPTAGTPATSKMTRRPPVTVVMAEQTTTAEIPKKSTETPQSLLQRNPKPITAIKPPQTTRPPQQPGSTTKTPAGTAGRACSNPCNYNGANLCSGEEKLNKHYAAGDSMVRCTNGQIVEFCAVKDSTSTKVYELALGSYTSVNQHILACAIFEGKSETEPGNTAPDNENWRGILNANSYTFVQPKVRS